MSASENPGLRRLDPHRLAQRAARGARRQGAGADRRRRHPHLARGLSAADLRRRRRGQVRRAGQRAQAQADDGCASGRVHRQPRIQRLGHAAAEEHHRLDFAGARARRAAARRVQEPRLRARRRIRLALWRDALADGAAPGAGARLRRAGDSGADHGVPGERGVRRDGQSEGGARRRFAQARGGSGSPTWRGRWRDGCARPADRCARPAVGRRRRGDGGRGSATPCRSTRSAISSPSPAAWLCRDADSRQQEGVHRSQAARHRQHRGQGRRERGEARRDLPHRARLSADHACGGRCAQRLAACASSRSRC